MSTRNKKDRRIAVQKQETFLAAFRESPFPPPIELSKYEYPCFFVRLINEFFCFSVINTILLGWNGGQKIFDIPRCYKHNLLILLNHYKAKIKNSDVVGFTNRLF